MLIYTPRVILSPVIIYSRLQKRALIAYLTAIGADTTVYCKNLRVSLNLRVLSSRN